MVALLKKGQEKKAEQLVVALTNFRFDAFDSNFEKRLYGDTSKMSDIEKSYWWYSGLFTRMMEGIDIDSYKDKIDEELFSIARDLYFNLCLFVDAFVRLDEIVLQMTKPSLFMLLEKTNKVYNYQMDVTGDRIQELYSKMTKRFKELYPKNEKI